MKKFNVQYGIGKAKYVVNFHDGIKKHEDGSEFFDCRIFKSKKKLGDFLQTLRLSGFIEQ